MHITSHHHPTQDHSDLELEEDELLEEEGEEVGATKSGPQGMGAAAAAAAAAAKAAAAVEAAPGGEGRGGGGGGLSPPPLEEVKVR
jgi:hypothetical protein